VKVVVAFSCVSEVFSLKYSLKKRACFIEPMLLFVV